MKSNPPTKSLFAPIKPRIVPIAPAPAPAPAPAKTLTVSSVEPPTAPKKEHPRPESSESKATPQQPAKVDEPLPPEVQIGLEKLERPDREAYAWAIGKTRDDGIPALIIVLNVAHPLIKRALTLSDHGTIRLLGAVGLAEGLYFHRGNKILRATLAAIRKSVIPAGKEDVHSIVFLSAVLAESPLLAPIDALPIFGDQAGLDATRYLVATIALQPPKQ